MINHRILNQYYGNQLSDIQKSEKMTLWFIIFLVVTSLILPYFVYSNYSSNGFNYMTIILGIVLLICIICIILQSITYNQLKQRDTNTSEEMNREYQLLQETL
jgi:uncharacterized membrane protein